MRLTFCVACGTTDDLQHHHLVTRAEGGSDDVTNLITLCTACHNKVHSRQVNGAYNHSQLTKAALAAAKARGQVLGNPKGHKVPSTNGLPFRTNVCTRRKRTCGPRRRKSGRDDENQIQRRSADGLWGESR